MRDEIQKILKIVGIIIFFSLVLLYVGYRVAPLLRGPIITITYPPSGIAVDEPMLEVTGITKKTTKLTMNSREITIDDEGKFIDRLLLVPGYNILVVDATDKFGKSRQRVLEVIFTRPAVLPPPSQRFFEPPITEIDPDALMEPEALMEFNESQETEQTIN